MVEDHHGGKLGMMECVKLKRRLLAEDQKVVPIFKQSTLKDDIITFSVGGDIINKSLKMAQSSMFCMKLLMRRKLYEKHQV
jgi:hypothetical protein